MTPFQSLKQPPGKASPKAMLRLAKKLELIQATDVLNVDLIWLNNNYQRSLTRYAVVVQQTECVRSRMTIVTRFWFAFCGRFIVTPSIIVQTHHKLMTQIYNHAQEDVDEQIHKQRRMIRNSLTTLHMLGRMILDAAIVDESLRQTLFNKVDKKELTAQVADVETWLTGKYSHVFKLVVERFPYIRQFAPTLLDQLDFRLDEGTQLCQRKRKRMAAIS